MGLTLWGMADEPTSPALIFCLKYSIDMYCHMSRSRSRMMVLMRRMASNMASQIVVVGYLGGVFLAFDAETLAEECGRRICASRFLDMP